MKLYTLVAFCHFVLVYANTSRGFHAECTKSPFVYGKGAKCRHYLRATTTTTFTGAMCLCGLLVYIFLYGTYIYIYVYYIYIFLVVIYIPSWYINIPTGGFAAFESDHHLNWPFIIPTSFPCNQTLHLDRSKVLISGHLQERHFVGCGEGVKYEQLQLDTLCKQTRL